jgi:hypothetical protein
METYSSIEIGVIVRLPLFQRRNVMFEKGIKSKVLIPSPRPWVAAMSGRPFIVHHSSQEMTLVMETTLGFCVVAGAALLLVVLATIVDNAIQRTRIIDVAWRSFMYLERCCWLKRRHVNIQTWGLNL